VSGLADAVVARLVEQRDAMLALDEEMSTILVRVASRDQSVAVEVDGTGTLTGLWLGPNAYRAGADALAQLIVDTAHAAAERSAERARELLAAFRERMEELECRPLTCWDGSVVGPQ
jgi:DNA-binding protein YbaB